MKDWLDDLLTDLPSEAAAPDLVRRAQSRLADVRRAEGWRRGVWHAIMAGATAAAAWLLIPQLWSLLQAAPELSYAGLGGWLRSLAASPPRAVIEALGQAFDLESAAASGMAPDLAIGLVLLALPALYVVARLLGGQDRQEARFG